MTREDEIAAKSKRSSTLKSLKLKKMLRLQQLKDEYQTKVREVSIQYAEDPERLKAKYAADDYAKNERAKARAAKQIEREQKRLGQERKLRPYTLGEEIFSSIVQGIGAALFIAATALLDVLAIQKIPQSYNATKIYFALYTAFGVSMILNHVMSVLHHALPEGAKEVFRRLNRTTIYLAIGTAFTIYSYTGICIVGIFLSSIGGRKMEIINVIFYTVLGWSGLFIFAQLYRVISVTSFSMLITSGIFFTIGLLFAEIRKVKYMHAIGNLIILSASVYLFFSFFFMF